MRILWLSNAPWAKTGYGNQTRIFWPRIKKLGHEVFLAANYGLNGAVLNVSEQGESAVVYPNGFETHGNDIMVPWAKHCKADYVITLYDSWPFRPNVTSQVRWCPWLPVDSFPLPEYVAQALRPAYQPIAYSKFGERMLQEAGFDPRYVPHGIETDVFKPMDRDEARKQIGLDPDIDFMAVMVAANKGAPSRKSFPEVLRAWKAFLEKHPKAVLFLHTEMTTKMSGLNLEMILSKLEMPEGSVMFCDPEQNLMGFPDSYMAKLFSAADVLLSPSQGEGFGLPIVEAQACGTPVIVTDCTAMSELGHAGWKVGYQPWWVQTGAWQAIPMIDDIINALECAYKTRGSDKLRKKARNFAKRYDADQVTEQYWKPVLDELAAELEEGDPLEVVTPEVSL